MHMPREWCELRNAGDIFEKGINIVIYLPNPITSSFGNCANIPLVHQVLIGKGHQ